MTGLDPSKDSIMSLACFVTDFELNLIEPNGFEAVVHHTDDELEQMGEWCTKQHGASGLTAACLASSTSAEQAANDLLGYVKKHTAKPKHALLAGNSVYADKMFLSRGPYAAVIEYLHYRILDVSAIKEAAKMWTSEDVLARTPRKAGKHEAKADILESIAEAKFYREELFTRA